MGLFNNKDFLIEIDKEDLKDAKLSSSEYDAKTQKRAFLNVLSARLAMKLLFDKKIEASNVYSLYTIQNILKRYNIADIYCGNAKIDVRLVFRREQIFVPKEQYDNGILPDLYLFLVLDSELTCAEFIGFIEPNKINKANTNGTYYFVEEENLSKPEEIASAIEKFANIEKPKATETDLVSAKELFLPLIDNEISKYETRFLLSQLVKSVDLRESLVEFENFELISFNVVKDNSILQDNVLEIVGAQRVYNEENQEPENEKAEIIGEVLSDLIETEELKAETNTVSGLAADAVAVAGVADSLVSAGVDAVDDTLDFMNELKDNSTLNENNEPQIKNELEDLAVADLDVSTSESQENSVTDNNTVEDLSIDNLNPLEDLAVANLEVSPSVEPENNVINANNTVEEASIDNSNELEALAQGLEDLALDTDTVNAVFDNSDNQQEQTSSPDESEINAVFDEFTELTQNFEQLMTPTQELEEFTANNAAPLENLGTEEQQITAQNEPDVNAILDGTLESVPNLENINTPIQEPEELSLDNNSVGIEDLNIQEQSLTMQTTDLMPQNIDFAQDESIPAVENTSENIPTFANEIEAQMTETPTAENNTESSDFKFEEVKTDEAEIFGDTDVPFEGLPEISLGYHDDMPDYMKAMAGIANQQTVSEPASEEIQAKTEESAVINESTEQANTPKEPIPPVSGEADETASFISEIDNFLNDVGDSDSNSDDVGELNLNEMENLLNQNSFNEETTTSQEAMQNTIQETETGETITETEDMQNDAENSPEDNDLLQVLFEEGKTNENGVNPPSSVNTNGKKGTNKLTIAAAIVGIAVAGAFAYNTYTTNVNQNAQLKAQNTELEQLQAEDKLKRDEEFNQSLEGANNNQEPMSIPGEDGKNTQSVSQNIEESMSNAFSSEPVNANISKIAWEIPEKYTYNDAFRQYLQVAGKNLKLNLQNELLLSDNMAYSDKIVIDMEISRDGGVQSSNITRSSGSKSIDNIVLRSVKSTLMYLKLPDSEIKEASVPVTLIISF